MLEVREIYKTFNAGTINEKRAMNGVTLTLNEGDFATVIGGNGAGKSTLLNLVAGVYPVDSGSIAIGGQNVTRLPEHKRARWPPAGGRAAPSAPASPAPSGSSTGSC